MINVETKTVVIYCDQMSMGGTETLILRLLSWYKQRDCRVILLTLKPITNQTILDDAKKIDFEHYVYDTREKDFFFDGKKRLIFSDEEKPLVLTQHFPEFFKCFLLLSKPKYNCNFTHTIYILHPYSTYLFSRRIAFIGRRLIDILLVKKSLVFMDEISIHACTNFYKIEKNYEFSIFRLPIFINMEDAQNEPVKNEIFNILSIARFEFPFKGYILGLIKSFSDLYQNDHQTSLTIIGYGNDKKEVDELIQTLPKDTALSITILDQMPNHRIAEYIRNCDVYVGMGTTLLDAANHSKIGIIAVSYQRTNLTCGFFYENYNSLGDVYEEGAQYQTFDELLLRVKAFSTDSFHESSMKSKQVLVDHYNIDIIAKQLLSHTDCTFTIVDRIIITSIIHINTFGTWLAENIYKKIKKWM